MKAIDAIETIETIEFIESIASNPQMIASILSKNSIFAPIYSIY